MRTRTSIALSLATVAATLSAGGVLAQPAAPTNEQVVVPQLDRRDVKLPRMPSRDIEVGAFAGTYSVQNFSASTVGGLRLGYHITEDVFVEGVYGQTRVSDESYRQVLPGGLFPDGTDTLSYYNLSAGYNLLPGEFFVGRKYAMPTAFYLIGGVGSTKFNEQRRSTINVGVGFRVLLKDRFAARLDFRDHIFSLDLLGKRQNTQNLEMTAGLTFFF